MHKKQQRTASKSPNAHKGSQRSQSATGDKNKPKKGPAVFHKMPSKAPTGITQEFFPRSAAAAAQKTQGYLFNQAPINRNAAKEEAKEKVASSKGTSSKRSAFVARLYQDEDEDGGNNSKVKQFEDEMKVFDMNADDSDGEKPAASKKRESK